MVAVHVRGRVHRRCPGDLGVGWTGPGVGAGRTGRRGNRRLRRLCGPGRSSRLQSAQAAAASSVTGGVTPTRRSTRAPSQWLGGWTSQRQRAARKTVRFLVAVVVAVGAVRGLASVVAAVFDRWSMPLTERRRTAPNAIMTAWQCGGQGFESPQLHPSDQAVLRFGGRLSSFLVPAWWPLEPSRCRRSPQRIAHPVGGVAAEGRHDVAVRVRGRAHLCVAEHLHDDPRVHALGEQQRRCRVPPLVEADVAHTCLVQKGLPCLPVRLPPSARAAMLSSPGSGHSPTVGARPAASARPASRRVSMARTFATTSARLAPETWRRSRRPFSFYPGIGSGGRGPQLGVDLFDGES